MLGGYGHPNCSYLLGCGSDRIHLHGGIPLTCFNDGCNRGDQRCQISGHCTINGRYATDAECAKVFTRVFGGLAISALIGTYAREMRTILGIWILKYIHAGLIIYPYYTLSHTEYVVYPLCFSDYHNYHNQYHSLFGDLLLHEEEAYLSAGNGVFAKEFHQRRDSTTSIK